MTNFKKRNILYKFILMNILFFGITFTASGVYSHEEHAITESAVANESNRFGPGKAIEAFDNEEGFKISIKATNSLGVKFSTLTNKGPWRLPAESIIHIKQSVAVYRRFEGWTSMVLVKINSRQKDFVEIQSADLEPGDEVAISGVLFLRMVDADLNSGTVDSHAH